MTKRVDEIKSSAIRKVFDKAANMKDIINFSIGQPDFNVPLKIKEDMIKALNENKTGYTSTSGINKLKEEILAKYKGDKFAESVIVTSGTSGALFLSYSAILEEEDELIVFDPYFVIYPDLARFLNAKPVIVETNKDYSINLANLNKAITPKTRAIMLNSPNNPTGYVYDKNELLKIAEIAKKNNLWVISDEVYEDYDYEKRFISMGKLYDKTIVLNGFSKNFALTGLRVGYAVGPKVLIDDMIKLQQYTFVCAPSIAQYAVAENFNLDIKENISVFKKRRDLVYNMLKEFYQISKPNGAFYFLIKVPKQFDEESFIEKCLDNHLLVVPGSAFSLKSGYFRIAYTVSDKDLIKGLNILIELAKAK